MSMGSEAIAAGVCHALSRGDQIIGTYRSHGIYLAKAQETDKFLAEMYGKVTGTSKGKAGSMHLISPETGLICTSAIVGTIIPVAVGAAFANGRAGNGKVVAVFFGDGAIDEGVFWESLNASCLMKVPVLFICEDNGFAVHNPAPQRHGYRSVAEIVRQFNCNVFESDSTDAEIIYSLTKDALSLMKENSLPCFLHLKYYRYLEHVGVFEDFAAGYRSRDEFEKWFKADPVRLQREKLLRMVHEDEVVALEEEINEQAENGKRRAQAAPFAEARVAYEDVCV
jgi:pyruvate dehydrogenase E1 component alpha subunit